jgi:mannosyltransferase OCH1-like enzyme
MKSDFVRIALLKKYGGVWIDSTVLLFKSLDDWCFNELEHNENKKIMCGFWQPKAIPIGKDYVFKDRDDYFENWFIATTKNNPIIEKWHFLVKKYWDNRKIS